ncbi:unnamed protein product, partial [Effrenium voratum]
ACCLGAPTHETAAMAMARVIIVFGGLCTLSAARSCAIDCPHSKKFPAMSLAGLAGELSVDLAAIKSIRFQLGSLNANTSIVSNSSGFDPSGCPFFRVVAGYERPEEEQSSDGWTFEAASFDAASG